MASPYFAATTTHIFTIFTTATNALGNAMRFAVEAVNAFAREVRRWFEEPLLRALQLRECPPIVTHERMIARSKAPLMFSEPAFVGAGPMLRRWR